MSVTKRDFESVAEILRRHGPTVATIKVTADLATYFGGRNDRFDRARFIKAAGVSESHISAAFAPGVTAAANETTV